MEFEWDSAKSVDNERRRGLPFAVAMLLFEGRVLQTVDNRQDYGERRIRAIGSVDGTVLHCVYTDGARCAGSSACDGQAGRNVMPIVRRTRADIDEARVRADLAARPQPSEAEIEAQAAEDGDAWTDEDLAVAAVVLPSPSAERVRALRARLGLTQSQFAQRFGFTVDTVQQYEQGRRRPSGPAAALLRVIEAAPEVVERALRERRPD